MAHPTTRSFKQVALRAIGAALIALGVFHGVLGKANSVKNAAASQLATYLDTARPGQAFALSNVAGVKWDYVCAVRSISYSHVTGQDTAEESLRSKVDFASLSKSDDTIYDGDSGLVFISESEQILVTLNLKRHLLFYPHPNVTYGACVPGKTSHLVVSAKKSRKQDRTNDLILSE